jgi:hypothetical protein
MALIVLEEPQLFQIIRDDFPAVKTIFRNIKRGKTQSSVKKKWEIEKEISNCTISLKMQQKEKKCADRCGLGRKLLQLGVYVVTYTKKNWNMWVKMEHIASSLQHSFSSVIVFVEVCFLVYISH